MTDADKSLTSKRGVTSPPLNPTAELESGFTPSAVRRALLGRPTWRPKSIVPEPWKEEVTPTSYSKVAPRVKMPSIEIPAPGMGAENSVTVF